LNRLDRLAEICRRFRAELLIDGVSSFGAEPIDLEGWNAAAVAATAGKCLHAIPGLAFVVARRDALGRHCRPPRSLYLDLAVHGEAQDRSETSFTPGVVAFHALARALDELAEQGGWRERRARYAELAQRIARGLAGLGVEPWLVASESSAVLRSYRLPAGLRYDVLHDELKKRGFVIYAGQGSLAGELFRISTMGEILDEDVTRLLAAFSEIVRRTGGMRT
jgi:2-aminoethylphosphonate-pyruvate transaminase